MKRLVSLFICLALAIGCMSGCGGKTNSSSDISASGMKILFSLSQADDFRSAVANKAKETAEKAIDLVLSSPSPYITIEFQGGEPLLNFDLIRFIVETVEQKQIGRAHV